MPDQLKFKLIPHEKEQSDYDWLNIDNGNERVGKVRGLINGRTLTIFSINIFPEYQGKGYGNMTINMFKNYFDIIIADRVRYTATGFWGQMGFVNEGNGNWIYKKMRMR